MKKCVFLTSLVYTLAGTAVTLGIIGLIYHWPMILCILLLLLAALLFSGVGIIMHRLLFQLEEQKAALTRLSQGDFQQHIAVNENSFPLTAEFSRQINVMGDRIQALLAQGLHQATLQEAILEGLNEGVLFADRRGMVKLSTPRVAQLLRSSTSTGQTGVLIKEEYLFLSGVNYNHVWSLMTKAMDHGKAEVQEINLSGEKEERYIEVYAAPLQLGSDSGALAVIRDVTHVKQLERMREDFVANVTHELKTPLTSIRGYIDILRSAPRPPEEAQEYYEILLMESERLQALINDLLELSEIQSGDSNCAKNEHVYIYQVGDEVFSELEPLADQYDIHMHLDVDPDLMIKGNYSRFKQLLTNLVSNAIKYNRPGGDVWIEGRQERDRIAIMVRDNGIGIPHEHLSRIFERFYSVSKSRSREMGGTGLGLAIVKHIATLFGGSVSVDSVLGQGTVFTVLLPL